METGPSPSLDDFYLFGDVYQTLEVCDRLNTQFARLRRQNLMSDEDMAECKRRVAAIRLPLEQQVATTNLMPRAPRLP